MGAVLGAAGVNAGSAVGLFLRGSTLGLVRPEETEKRGLMGHFGQRQEEKRKYFVFSVIVHQERNHHSPKVSKRIFL